MKIILRFVIKLVLVLAALLIAVAVLLYVVIFSGGFNKVPSSPSLTLAESKERKAFRNLYKVTCNEAKVLPSVEEAWVEQGYTRVGLFGSATQLSNSFYNLHLFFNKGAEDSLGRFQYFLVFDKSMEYFRHTWGNHAVASLRTVRPLDSYKVMIYNKNERDLGYVLKYRPKPLDSLCITLQK
jgi:hypothetical protein